MQRKHLLSILFTLAGAALVWWQLHSMTADDKEKFIQALKAAKPVYIIPVVLLNLGAHLLRAVRWRLLLQPLGYRPALGTTYASVLISNSVNSVLPRVGEVLKCTTLAQKEKLSIDKLLGTVVVERIVDLFSYVAFIAITLSLQAGNLKTVIQDKLGSIKNEKLNSVIIFIAAIVLAIVFLVILLGYLHKKYPANRLVTKTRSIMQGLLAGVATIKNLDTKALFLGLTIVIWTLYLMQTYVGMKSMDATAGLGLSEACAVLTLASLSLTLTPGGMGSFPFFVMQALLLFNIDKTNGNAFGWLMWGMGTAVALLSGLISWLILPYLKSGSRSPGKNVADHG